LIKKKPWKIGSFNRKVLIPDLIILNRGMGLVWKKETENLSLMRTFDNFPMMLTL
jgi:hypothetical protein